MPDHPQQSEVHKALLGNLKLGEVRGEWSPRDYLHILKLDFDIHSQREAIALLLESNRTSAKAHEDEIDQARKLADRTSGLSGEQAVDHWVDQMHRSVYIDAAHSMAALGMIAPLVETVFYQCFRGIGQCLAESTGTLPQHSRWNGISAIKWDCHFSVAGGRTQKDLVEGILQLSDAVGLTPRLPPDLKITLSALFAYRNMMFHNGLEWPEDERAKFAKRIEEKKWPKTWFPRASVGENPWVFYMSEDFIAHCLKTVNEALDAFGQFVKEELVPALQARMHRKD